MRVGSVRPSLGDPPQSAGQFALLEGVDLLVQAPAVGEGVDEGSVIEVHGEAAVFGGSVQARS
jgi:hypothetical protein